MQSKRILYYKLRVLLTVCIIWVLFGLLFLFNILEVEKHLLDNRSLLTSSLTFATIGLPIATILIFYLKDAFSNYPLWMAVLLKLFLAFILFLVIAFCILAAYVVFSYQGNFKEFSGGFFRNVFLTRGFFVLMVDMGALTLISTIIMEVTNKYGPGGFERLMLGEYNKPRIKNRIFIFLDINNATTIAENIGHEKYFLLLKDFFADITSPLMANGGEIYQYVGDEVVISWPTSPLNKIYALKFIRQAYYIIKRKEENYLKKYTMAPGFKAGIHSGDVTAGFIGIVKKDLVYSGDTLNTAARLRGKCNELKKSFILSGNFMKDFHQPYSYHIEDIGEMELKGKKEKEKLYSLTFE